MPLLGGITQMFYKYMYFYKTENLINNKFYYGIHRTNNLNDGYLGSGLALQHALKKYGEEFFTKTIIKFFESEEELLSFEEKVVTKELVNTKNCYNLACGGKGPTSLEHELFWKSEDGEELKRLLSKKMGGYNNPDFAKRWLPKYKAIANEFCDLIINTNLPDVMVTRRIRERENIKFKRVFNYCVKEGLLPNNFFQIKVRDYFTSSREINTFVKTEVLTDTKDVKIYKAFNQTFLKDFDCVMDVLNDLTISDSMLYNDSLGLLESRRFLTKAAYFEYLGLITYKEQIPISSRFRLPLSRRIYSLKSIYELNKNFKQSYFLIGDTLDDKYKISYDGHSFSTTRL